MELFYELLLTAAASLLVAFLLAKLFSANDPRCEPDRAVGPSTATAEEKEEEERIIEVDEVKVKGARADVAAEGWVEVEKTPATVVEGKAECLVEGEGVAAKVARDLFLGAASEERKEEGEVGGKQCDLTAAAAATETVVEVKPHDLGVETAPREVLDVGLEKERVQDVAVEQHDCGAEAAPSEVLDAGLEKQGAQVIEAVEVQQQHLFAGAAPAEVLDAVLGEEWAQAIEVRPPELASETVPGEVLYVVSERQEEQVIEVKKHELAADAAPRAILDVALAETEELKEQAVEEAVDVHEEVQSKEEVEREPHPVDQREELVPKKELVVRKTGDLEVSQEGSSNDKVAVQLTEKEVTLLGMPEDEARADMEFGEWEGIERSEVEKRFGAAAAFAGSDAGAAALSKLDTDVQLQLQGLLKVAIDGPCYDSTQPLTLRPSSRAKWFAWQKPGNIHPEIAMDVWVAWQKLGNIHPEIAMDVWVAWQKLGNMHPEIAMEKYMNLLSETIPGWMGDKTSDTTKHEADGDSEGPVLTMTAHTSDQHSNRGNVDSTSMDGGPLTSPPNPDKGQSSDIPAE